MIMYSNSERRTIDYTHNSLRPIMKGCKIMITVKITVDTKEMKEKIGTKIHDQLVGNQDYIDSRIILNIDEDKDILLYIDDECTDKIPAITLFD